MKKLILVALVLAGPAMAQTNFAPLANYPAPACVKPAPLPDKPLTTNNVEIERFNLKIAEYNRLGHAFVACINLYIGNADADMDMIRRKARAAADAANGP